MTMWSVFLTETVKQVLTFNISLLAFLTTGSYTFLLQSLSLSLIFF